MVYKFNDIIINSLEKRAGIPGDEKNYITIGNIQTKNLAITEWGVAEPFSDERLIVKKGDVLFIKRDPFNHQVGISPIDGLFTGFGMVLKPKTEVILPEFLPYFIFSETFINKASSIAVGTKYKTCNWKELKNLEFDIPDFDEQAKIVSIAKEFDSLSEHYASLIADLQLSTESYLQSITSANCNTYSLGQLMSFQTKTEKISDSSVIDYITYDEIANNAKRKQSKGGSFYAYRLKSGQIIAPRNAFCNGAMALIPSEYEGYYTANVAQVFNVNTSLVLPEYLFKVISRPSFIARLENTELSVSNWDLYFSHHCLEIPSLEEQNKYLTLCSKINTSIDNAYKCKEQTYKSLQSVLCEHIT